MEVTKVAEIIDKISKTVKSAAEYTKKKASISLLKATLKSREFDLDECFEKLGRAFFAQAKGKAKNDEKIANLILKADELSLEIKALKKEIAERNDSVVCPHCGTVYSSKKKSCPNCENKMIATKKEAETPEDETK